MWSLSSAVNACMYKHHATLMSGPQAYSTFEDSQVRQDCVCVCFGVCMLAGLFVHVHHVTEKSAQTRLLLLSSQTLLPLSRPSGPLLASKSSANIVNILDAMTVSLFQKAAEDVCAGLLSASAHVQSFRLLKLSSSQT